MFCNKCGNDVGDARFCTKCGNQVSAKVEKVNEPIVNNNTAPKYTNNVKKKKKWPIFTGVAAGVIAVAALATYFVWPLLSNKVIDNHPTQEVQVVALKASASNISAVLEEKVSMLVPTQDMQRLKGSMTLKKALVGDYDYSKSLKSKVANFDFQLDYNKEIFAGSLGVGTTSGKSEIEMSFYDDNSKFYVKVPELFSEAIMTDSSADFSDMFGNATFNKFQKYYSNMSPEETAKIFSAVVKSSETPINEFIESISYTKNGEETIVTDAGNVKTTVYDVSFTAEQVKTCLKGIVNNLYQDKEISSYMSMLSLFGYSKDTVISMIDAEDWGSERNYFKIYMDESQQIIRITDEYFDFKFIGKENPYNHFDFTITDDKDVVKFNYLVDGTREKMEVSMTIGSASSYEVSYVGFGYDATTTVNGKSQNIKFDDLYIEANLDYKSKMDIRLSADVTAEEISALSVSASSFAGAIDSDKITDEQAASIVTQVYSNFSVFNKILGDTEYNILYKALTGASGTSSITPSTKSPGIPGTSSSSGSVKTY